ncbi:MAG: POTRA domain-containing protein, partial [Chitinophagaceae bacterium]
MLTSVLLTAIAFGQGAAKVGHGTVSKDTLNKADAPDLLYKARNFIVGEIAISGNRKTKKYLIERELPFQKGDSVALDDLVSRFDLARQRLMNTRLFNDAVVSLKNFDGYQVNIQIDLKERWYIFPVPYFRPIDRNLQEWAKRGYDLSRVNYGAKFDYYNFTGRNDKLKAWFITGYTRQIEFSYEQPNADKSLKHGYGVNVS